MKNGPKSTPAAQWRAAGEVDPHAGRYDGERADLSLGYLSDDELANGAFMNYDGVLDIQRILAKDPDYHSPIAWMTAVKDRIRWLSRKLEESAAEIERLSTPDFYWPSDDEGGYSDVIEIARIAHEYDGTLWEAMTISSAKELPDQVYRSFLDERGAVQVELIQAH